MPGAQRKRDILHQLPIAANKAVGRHAQVMDISKIGVNGRVKASHKQVINPGATKLTGRQADVVNHQQRDIVSLWALVVMR